MKRATRVSREGERAKDAHREPDFEVLRLCETVGESRFTNELLPWPKHKDLSSSQETQGL